MSSPPDAWAPRRFWRAASIAPAGTGHTVLLDDRPLRTPAKAPLILPTPALAKALAAEWDAQDGRIRPQTMPLTRAANAAIDRVAPNRPAVRAELAGYGETDLLCYRAAAPSALVARQAATWDPLLDWAAASLGARLVTVEGVMHQPQPAPALAALAAALAEADDFALTALHELVSLSGSLVIGLAILHHHAPAEDLWEAAHLDQTWQAEQWGADAEAAAELALRRAAFLQARDFLALSRP